MNEACRDRIYIRDLYLRCIVGIYEEERRGKQDVTLNITLHVDLRQAGRTDRIEHTVDYKAIKNQVVGMVEESEFFLIEKLAEEAAAICLGFPGVAAVEVMVDKPGALRYARSVAVHIFRQREPDE